MVAGGRRQKAKSIYHVFVGPKCNICPVGQKVWIPPSPLIRCDMYAHAVCVYNGHIGWRVLVSHK